MNKQFSSDVSLFKYIYKPQRQTITSNENP